MNHSELRVTNALFPKSIQIPELGPGPRRGTLSIATLDEELATLADSSQTSIKSVRALALEWHDHHDAAHEIVQDMPSADAAYIHAILHRREPDYFNAKYWFRRVGDHPTFPQLAAKAEAIIRESSDRASIGELLLSTGWDAYAFVDACENPGPVSSPRHSALQKIQQAEFEILLTHLLQRSS